MRQLFLLLVGCLFLSALLSAFSLAAEVDDFKDALNKLEPRAKDLRTTGYSPVRQTLQKMLDVARERNDLPAQIAILRRVARLAPSEPQSATPTSAPNATSTTTPTATEKASIEEANKATTLTFVDQQFERQRLAIDKQLAEIYGPLRRDVEKAYALSLTSPAQQSQSMQLWDLLYPLPQEWSPELLTEPFMAEDAYDTTHALPIVALPAYLELTVEPGGHDVDIGISGKGDEEITQIYLGGWWGRQSGLRSAPGGQDLAGKNEFALFDAARKLPSEAELLQNDRAGTPFHSTLPTTFRISVSACGIVVSRTDVMNTEVVMRTPQPFNTPTAFVFRSPTYRLTSLRISPTSVWKDASKLPPTPTEPTGF